MAHGFERVGFQPNTVQLGNEAVVFEGAGLSAPPSWRAPWFVILSHVPCGFIARAVDEGPLFAACADAEA